MLAASAYPDEAYALILMVEDMTMAELENCQHFHTMDAQLMSRIMESVNGQLKTN